MRALAARVGLAVASLVIALAAVELVFRAIDPPAPVPPCLRREGVARDEHCVFNDYHPLLGFDGKRSFRGTWGAATATHNSLGFRGPEVDLENPRGDRRILFLGDSQTWGFGLGDDETIPVAVESILDRDANPPGWEAINLGLSGYGPDQSFLRYLVEGRPLDPGVVVFVLFPNDLTEVRETHAWNVTKPRFYFSSEGALCLGNVPPERLPGWESNQIVATDPFWARFATLRFLMNQEWPPWLLAWLDRPNREVVADAIPCITAEPGPQGDALSLTGAILERLADVVLGAEKKLVVVWVPIRFQLESIQAQPYYRELDRRLRARGVATVELRRRLWEYAQGHRDAPVFDSSGHLSAAAIRDVVAPAIAAAILSSGAAPPPSRTAIR